MHVHTSVADPDPHNFPSSVPKCFSDLDLDPDPTLMSTTKVTERENLTFACCLAPGGTTDKETQVKLYQSTVLGTLPF